ncbi:MAG: ATP-binding domain-containing protein, partial [Burkholderiaceae bacterium]|nr:ATP-binding domain-containing protein [Burkholderiaceae bacterium]
DILDFYYLMVDRIDEIRNVAIEKLETWEKAKKYAEEAEDVEMQSKIKVVERYCDAIPKEYRMIRNQAVERPELGITITTSHRSKGQEWYQVILADDFLDLAEMTIDKKYVLRDEINLSYVAVTRAQRKLILEKQFF